MEAILDAHRQKISAALVLLLALHRERREKKIKRKSRMWSRKWLLRRNMGLGVLNMLQEELSFEDPKAFRSYTRLEKSVFEELLVLVTPLIQKQDTVMREAISPRERLGATLRYLATGKSFKDLSFSTRIAPNTLSKLVPQTLEAIVEVLKDRVFDCPSSPAEWEVVAKQYEELWQFPHCIGALDGKHINFRPSRKDGSQYRNYKGRGSIVLLGLVDAEYKFLFVDIGKNGRMHDASVFRESPLSENLNSESLNLPLPTPLPGYNFNLPYVIVADDAFPLKVNIMKPYPGRLLTREHRIFNYRLSRARRTIENAFAILANRFRVLLNVIPLSVDKVELITWACCGLHNFILQKKVPEYIPCEFRGGNRVNSNSNLDSASDQSGDRCADESTVVRDHFSTYFNTVGTVPWQNVAVEEGH